MSDFVYFAEAGDGSVKIGVSRHPPRRVANLNTSTPGGCALLFAVDGGRGLEAALHRKLEQHRVTGEWFRPAAEVLEVLVAYRPRAVDFDKYRTEVPAAKAKALEDAGRYVRMCACPASWGERVPDAIKRAAKRLGFTQARTKSYWYGQVQEVPAHELAVLREVALRHSDDPGFLSEEIKRLRAEMDAVGAALLHLPLAPEVLATLEPDWDV